MTSFFVFHQLLDKPFHLIHYDVPLIQHQYMHVSTYILL